MMYFVFFSYICRQNLSNNHKLLQTYDCISIRYPYPIAHRPDDGF